MTASDDSADRIRRSHQYRSRYRDRNHESAHAEPAGDNAVGPDHPSICREAATLITTEEGLSELLNHLRAEGAFAYDSEFIGELTYNPKLCLIQVATTRRVALIDPLVGLDLKPFWELICEPSVQKIVHAGEQDIEPVFRYTTCRPQNIFDTQIAAGMAGMAYPTALSKLVEQLVGARLGKGLTFTHWDQRPLSASQLRYAADDVRYLPALRERLGDRLEEMGHLEWALEESAGLCEESLYRFDPETAYQRVRGAATLMPRNLAVLREMVNWRDEAARAHDLPPRALLRDEILIELARNPVRSVEKLDRVRGLPRPIEEAHGQRIVDLTLKALALPAESMPRQKHADPSPAERFSIDALWAATQCLCLGQGIDPNLACSRQEIGDVFHLFQKDQSVPQSRLFKGWRKAAVSDPLTELLRGGKTLTVGWGERGLKVS